MQCFYLWRVKDLVQLQDKQGSDNAKHQTGDQLHDHAVKPEVESEHAGGAQPGGL